MGNIRGYILDIYSGFGLGDAGTARSIGNIETKSCIKGGNMETKSWIKSKTIWFNVLSGLVGIVATLQADKGLPPHLAEIFGTVVTLGNIGLRFMTNTGVTK